MKTVEALISDADGTLVDTVDLIRHGQHEAAKTYFERHGIPANEIPDYDNYERHLNEAVGGSTRNTFEKTARLLYEAAPHHLEGMDFDELDSFLNPIQDRLAPEYVKAYEGLADTFTLLGQSGIKLAVFTSGTAHHVVRNFGAALPELGLVELHKDKTLPDIEKLHIFENTVKQKFQIPEFTVVTVTDTEKHKPEPDSLLLAMQRLDVSHKDAAVLGDHTVDMQAAVNADVPMRIGITHGFHAEELLKDNGATHTISSLQGLAPLLTSR